MADWNRDDMVVIRMGIDVLLQCSQQTEEWWRARNDNAALKSTQALRDTVLSTRRKFLPGIGHGATTEVTAILPPFPGMFFHQFHSARWICTNRSLPGAVLVRMSDLKPIDDRSWFIEPKLHPVLSECCTELTSITQGQVDAGLPFEGVCELIAEWLEAHRERRAWGSWGVYDRHQRNAGRLGMPSPFAEHPHVNPKTCSQRRSDDSVHRY